MTIIQTTKQLQPRHDFDFYETPIELCRAAIKLCVTDEFSGVVMDAGYGSGNWAKALRQLLPRNDIAILGVDIRDIPELKEYTICYPKTDYLTYQNYEKFDLIMGNPPYKYAEEFVRKSLTMIKIGGTILFLLPLSFLESTKRGRGLFSTDAPFEVIVSMRRVSFTGNGKSDNTPYALFEWIKGYGGINHSHLSWLDWDYDDKN